MTLTALLSTLEETNYLQEEIHMVKIRLIIPVKIYCNKKWFRPLIRIPYKLGLQVL